MRSTLNIVTLLMTVLTVQAGEGQWNQWRGPNRDGYLVNDSWPVTLNGQVTQLWERPHGPSYSGPIVCGDLLITTETVDKKTERVTAYRLDSADVAWSVEWPGAMTVPFFAASNGDWIRSTPACTETHLVVLGMRDVMVCLDPKTGEERWRVDFPAQLGSPLPVFGAVCSPLIDGDAVYVQTGGALAKLALADGQVIWTSLKNGEDMMSSGAFSSPTIATLGGVRQLLVQTREALCGVDLETGSVYWSQPIESFRGMNILTPLVVGDRVFTSAHSGKAELFEITRTTDGQWSVNLAWMQKSQAYMSSPILIGESIYLHLKNQRVCAFNVADGQLRWTSSPFGKYWSMITNGKQILALDNSGELLLINPNDDELVVADRMKVANDAWAHLAIAGDKLIVRDLAALKVFQFKPGT
jgi:outer membrane protein assembly factor BamB